ncbi:hypothetical protein KU6B_42530 [Mameliella alba]|uniref:DUF6525 family protein n=1 Tax=Mameliella alba TaxID=561184 RepID=UPI0013E4ABFF|nr:DUF6525 family protein [Mameliella alba]BBU57988.1 hypothetical protein KU6B_42530 [Mameliella alba]
MARRNGNRGAVAIRPRRRRGDAMRVYDSLPAPLRRWMAGAVLRWSPESCLAIWRRAGGPDEALERLNRAERATLDRAGL